MKRILFLIIAFAMVSSCVRENKQKYLKDYGDFMEEVSKNSKGYSKAEWKETDLRYDELNKELYSKYKAELTTDEKRVISGYRVKYISLKASANINNFYQNLLKDDVSRIKKEIKYYIDNKMESDLKRLLDEAKKLSNELYEELKQIKEELEKETK